MATIINASTSAGLVTTADTSGNLNLQSNGSTIVAVTSAGAAVTGTLSATGAVTIPSVAGSFYSEGTWTPSQGAGLTVVGTFSSGGTWTKIGRLVNVSGFVKGTTSVAVATAATVIAGNLPFTVLTGTTAYYMGNATNNDANVNIGILAFQNTTNIISVQTVAATPGIYFSCTYTV